MCLASTQVVMHAYCRPTLPPSGWHQTLACLRGLCHGLIESHHIWPSQSGLLLCCMSAQSNGPEA